MKIDPYSRKRKHVSKVLVILGIWFVGTLVFQTLRHSSVQADGPINVWWPSSGATVEGTQPFKAMVEGLDIAQYKMYWQVDGDRLNEMANSTQDYPHKESWVDVSSWNWKGSGPYTINFVSKNSSGAIISEKSVNILIVH